MVNVPAASLYDTVIFVPACTKAPTLSSTLSLVKYRLLPSDKSPVFEAAILTSALASALALV